MAPPTSGVYSMTPEVVADADTDLKHWSMTWRESRSAVLAWACSPRASLAERQEVLFARLDEALQSMERAQPLFFVRSVPEVDAVLVACTVRDSADGRSFILRTLAGETKATYVEPSFAPAPSDDPKARLVDGFGLGFGSLSPATEVLITAVQGLVSAIDAATWSEPAARRRVPLPSSPHPPAPLLSVVAGGAPSVADEAKTMYTAAQACAVMQRDYPLLNVTLADAEKLIVARQATLRFAGAIMLIIAAEGEGEAPSQRVLECMARARALQASCVNAARDLEQRAWAAAPLWLTRRSPELCLHTCDGVAALSLWGRVFFGHDAGDESAHLPLLAMAHFANPHLLHYVAQLRSAPAQCGLPATQQGTDRRASAWFAAVRVASDTRHDAGREPREPWTSADAISAARELLTGPFDATQPLHAASLAHAERARTAAAAAYAREAYTEAAEAFSYAMAVVPWADAPGAALARAAMLSSRAQCALRASMPAAAEADCTASLALRPGDVKTLLRRARARHETGAAGAEDDLAEARAASG